MLQIGTFREIYPYKYLLYFNNYIDYYNQIAMKKSYIFDGYDQLIRQLITQNQTSTKKLNDDLAAYSNNSYRIYKIYTQQHPEPKIIRVDKPIHSQHPNCKMRDLKSIFKLPQLSIYLQELLKMITLQNDKYYLALSTTCSNYFYLYEKCSIIDLPTQEKVFLLYKLRSEELNKQIKERLRSKVFKLSNEEDICNLMHKIQLTIQHYSSQLSNNKELESLENQYTYSEQFNITDCYKIVYSNLEKFQFHLENHYESYIDKNMYMSSISVNKKLIALSPKIDTILNHLLASNASAEILSLYSVPINLLKNYSIVKKITYYQFEYINKFINFLDQAFKSNKVEITTSHLISWLLDLNYNSLQYFNLKTDLILSEIKKFDSDTQILEYLYSKLKNYKQHRTNISIAFNHQLPDIKEQISQWIEEEIEFIQRRQQLDNRYIGTLQRLNTSNKILLNLSVAQISYFIYILVQTGIIKHQNLKDVFRMVADNFKTKNTDSISVESISSKYYNVENSTKQSMKEKIIQLLNFTKL